MTWQVRVRRRFGANGHRFELDVDFASDARRLVLFGPSGAGKSLTLKAIAGLMRPDEGRIAIEGHALYDAQAGIDVPARRRGVAYVFQDYALFPHLTVLQNVGFGLVGGWRNPSKRFRHEAVDRWLRAFELEGLANRYPEQLSGGQRQRTALARALVSEPRALLLDEPFAALDSALRRRLRAELAELQQRLSTPMALITHDEADVQAFGDDVVCIDHGRVTGRPVLRHAADAAPA